MCNICVMHCFGVFAIHTSLFHIYCEVGVFESVCGVCVCTLHRWSVMSIYICLLVAMNISTLDMARAIFLARCA